jgi:hypothetical protein
MDDQDLPPDLVQAPMTQDDGEEQIAKVPITIVTGSSAISPHVHHRLLTKSYRISGCRQNNAAELYPDGRAWQENSCYYERLVSFCVLLRLQI